MNRHLKQLVRKNSTRLQESKMNFEALYNIIFSNNGILAEDTDGYRINTYTFDSTRKKIEELSSAIYEKIGATHDFVAIDMENSIDWVITFWAILRSGNKPYLVNCRHPESLANSALKTLNIKYIFGKEASRLNGTFIDITSLRATNIFNGDFENEIALSTSATSLKEVICFYTGDRISSQLLNVTGFIKKYPDIAKQYHGRIKNLAFLPFYHVFGLIAVYFWFTFFGQTVVFLKNYSPESILKTCKKHEVTHVFAVPLLWHTIEHNINKKATSAGEKKVKKLRSAVKLCTALQNIFPRLGMSISQKIMGEVTGQLFGRSIKFCISGGSYIRQSALELINGIGYNLHNGYGMTEIGITSVDLRMKPKHKNQSSIGKPFASVEYKINDDGVLMVKGSSLCSKISVNGKEVPMDTWFNTGDNMEIKDGYYYIKGRVGDVIIGDNGENINPDVIEQNFSLPEADNFCILGLEADGKTTVSMIVQLNKYTSVAKRNSMLDKIISANEKLPMTSRVQSIYYTTDNICSATAVKVSRSYVLRAIKNSDIILHPFKKDVTLAEEDAAYSSEMLLTVKNIVSGVLDIPADEIDIHANVMLDMGADSIQYFAILEALAEEFSVTATEKNVMYYTVHEFCQYIERHM